METKTIELRDFWIELDDVRAGVLLQKTEGAIVYYLYSESVPDKKRDGILLTRTDAPLPLFGGRIWVRSVGYAVIAYTAAAVDLPGLAIDIGNRTQLPTNNKESIVDAIIELDDRISAVESGRSITYKYEVTLQDIVDKQFTLLHKPNRESITITPHMGVLQFLDIDYTLTDQIVSWNSLAMELLLEVGQLLMISYIQE